MINDPADGWIPAPRLEGRVWWRALTDKNGDTHTVQFNDANGCLMLFVAGPQSVSQLVDLARALSSGLAFGERDAQARMRAALGLP